MAKREYDDDDDLPPRRRRRPVKKAKKQPNAVLILVLVGVGLLVVGTGSVVAYLVFREKPAPPTPKLDPFPNMLAHWSFDNIQDGKVIDQTGRGNDGFLTGGRLASGVKGNALWLDGRDDQYCELKPSKDLDIAAGVEFTIAAWYKTSDRAGTIMAFRNSERLTQLDLYVRTDHLLGIVGDDSDDASGHAFIWNDNVNDGNWHHAALTRHGKIIELFCDGVSVGIDSRGHCSGRLSGDMRYIGANLKFTEEDKRKIPRVGFKGGIDEVYVFARALPAHEIQALMKR